MLTALIVFVGVGLAAYLVIAHLDRKEQQRWEQERRRSRIVDRYGDWGED